MTRRDATAAPSSLAAAVAAALVAESRSRGADFRGRVALVATAGHAIRRISRSSGRQGAVPRATLTENLRALGIGRKRARLWQAVAEAEPRLDRYLADVAQHEAEPSLGGLVRFASPRRAEKVERSAWDVWLASFTPGVAKDMDELTKTLKGRHGCAALGDVSPTDALATLDLTWRSVAAAHDRLREALARAAESAASGLERGSP